MSAYTNNPGHFEAAGGIMYVNMSPIIWEIWRVGSGDFFIVPAGTVFDVSIPFALRWAFDPHDKRYLKASALHDVMLIQGIDRVRAAAEFNLALKADGVSAARRLAMTAAVAFYKFS